MEGRKEIIKETVFPNGVNRVHIPVLTPEEEAERHQRLYEAGAKLIKAQIRAHMEKGETV